MTLRPQVDRTRQPHENARSLLRAPGADVRYGNYGSTFDQKVLSGFGGI
jgi:hypothetical protein